MVARTAVEAGPGQREAVVASLSRLVRAFARRGVLSSAYVDLTVLQWKAMVVITTAGRINTQAIARLLGVSMPSMSRVVGRLVEKDLVQRVPDPNDRRYIWLEATHRFSEEIWPVVHGRDIAFAEGVVDALSKEQVAVLARVLPALTDAAEAELKHAVPVAQTGNGNKPTR